MIGCTIFLFETEALSSVGRCVGSTKRRQQHADAAIQSATVVFGYAYSYSDNVSPPLLTANANDTHPHT